MKLLASSRKDDLSVLGEDGLSNERASFLWAPKKKAGDDRPSYPCHILLQSAGNPGPIGKAMDRWYLCKDFFVFLMEHRFDWVTKAKRNTARGLAQ